MMRDIVKTLAVLIVFFGTLAFGGFMVWFIPLPPPALIGFGFMAMVSGLAMMFFTGELL